jgi:DNA-binding CsgD family transcriptional regulator
MTLGHEGPARATARPPLERAAEVAAITAALASAAEGAGGLVVIEGPAGIGKSSLLGEAATEAGVAGLRVLRARAVELERRFPFAAALQLFEPVVRDAGDDALLEGAAGLARPLLTPAAGRGLPGTPDEFSVVHGLYWLAANLADRQPLAILVDDAHWADEPSLRLCAYLAQRIDELPIALVVALRPSEPGAPEDLLARLRGDGLATLLRPAPLSAAAVATLVADAYGETPDEAFAAQCARMTAGNPHLVGELLGAAATEGLRPTAEDAERIPGIVPDGVHRAVGLRLAALPDDAARLARAVAILGDDASLRHAAALAGLNSVGGQSPDSVGGLSPDAAAAAADALAAADVLCPGEPLRFVHPLTAAAVDAALPRAARAAAHLRAAELLRDDGAPADRTAAHLLGAPATGAPWVAATLREAAGRAMGLGAPASAVELLRRALAEPPPAAERAGVLRELARAELAVNDAAALERLDEAARLVDEPAERVEALRDLARSRVSMGDHAGARAAYRDALAALDGADPELTAHLRAEELVVAALAPAAEPDARAVEAILADGHVGDTPAGRALLASLAVHELYAGAPLERVLPLAEQALGGGALLDDEGAETTSVYGVVLVLFVCEQLGRADELLTTMLARARSRGSAMAVASLSYSRAWSRLISARVAEAVDDAQQAVDAGRGAWRQFLPGAHGALVHALLDAGEAEQAARQLAEAEALDDENVTAIQLLDARGRLLAARGDHAGAAREFLRAGELAGAQRNPLLFATWRSNAGLALARTGDRDRARALVEEELELARAFGAPRGLAVALRALGAIEGGAGGLAHLEESVAVLDGSEAKLELGRSLAELGGALRRAGRRGDAGRVLGDALELARSGGAGAIERRAADELAVAGARAERAARRGREALSPSERRVAQLAASGLSNREIAEELFVTRKAVEWHLRNAYVKLGISSRRDLPAALKL